ncbi:MAG: SHOCT domain-containing protein [Candidatus Contendobacter sp.]|nr:SHOCT domain-containing protein [Candidatus Contendobacter sp.]
MQSLSPAGQQVVNDLAQRYNFSPAAVASLLDAVIHGQGSMAQFNHPELGGSGQWMAGGMIMLSDMFNQALKSRVEGLCSELASLVNNQPDLIHSGSFQSQRQSGGNHQQQQDHSSGNQQPQHEAGPVEPVSLFIAPASGSSGDWWGADLRWPTSTGAQNDVRYAYFAQARRLAIDINGQVTIYDTLDHHIGGFSQQQGYGGSLTFSSQYGLVEVSRLPVLSVDGQAPWTSAPNVATPSPPPSIPADEPIRCRENDVFVLIERLADLHAKGILSSEEFAAKKRNC